MGGSRLHAHHRCVDMKISYGNTEILLLVRYFEYIYICYGYRTLQGEKIGPFNHHDLR